ncbi:poly-gamma-glutamate hydrolase family protein [Streptomyces katsurahamanus]|uniref:Phage replication protein n=1 Tax=Streptomyces katsurahamanus TaxID=2577098 RepID=A0ABW9NM70_9ACTN|nr:poly-gamma-glutamate hydrolase family protein [Streptomyces katsurahamanus]MQS34318.1 phage replication protein [Streptomyces katsurahamanus]
MTEAKRRTILTALAGAAVGGGLLGVQGASTAYAAPQTCADPNVECYTSNNDLYEKIGHKEGTDFGRRFKRHERSDTDLTAKGGFSRTTVTALHGGGIESGTSEICLRIAGYRPDTLTPAAADAALYDYWMFEGLRTANNHPELHITSTACDDRIAVAMAVSSLNVLSVHGCTSTQAGLGALPLKKDREAVVVGGSNTDFKNLLLAELGRAGFKALNGNTLPPLAGRDPENLCNRTMLGMGGQLEMTTELRESLFLEGGFTREKRPTHTHPERFPAFANAVRTAIDLLERMPEQQIR